MNIRKHVAPWLFAVTASATWQIAHAEDVSVKLTGADEVPAVDTKASGKAKFTIGKDHTVSGSVKTSNIDGTAAHIHLGEPGKSGPPIVTLVKGADGVWSTPADAKFNEEQYTAFKEGKLYVNVHSEDHKPGEIRGQLQP